VAFGIDEAPRERQAVSALRKIRTWPGVADSAAWSALTKRLPGTTSREARKLLLVSANAVQEGIVMTERARRGLPRWIGEETAPDSEQGGAKPRTPKVAPTSSRQVKRARPPKGRYRREPRPPAHGGDRTQRGRDRQRRPRPHGRDRKKGGAAVSEDRHHMAEIGRGGGSSGQQRPRAHGRNRTRGWASASSRRSHAPERRAIIGRIRRTG